MNESHLIGFEEHLLHFPISKLCGYFQFYKNLGFSLSFSPFWYSFLFTPWTGSVLLDLLFLPFTTYQKEKLIFLMAMLQKFISFRQPTQ